MTLKIGHFKQFTKNAEASSKRFTELDKIDKCCEKLHRIAFDL